MPRTGPIAAGSARAFGVLPFECRAALCADRDRARPTASRKRRGRPRSSRARSARRRRRSRPRPRPRPSPSVRPGARTETSNSSAISCGIGSSVTTQACVTRARSLPAQTVAAGPQRAHRVVSISRFAGDEPRASGNGAPLGFGRRHGFVQAGLGNLGRAMRPRQRPAHGALFTANGRIGKATASLEHVRDRARPAGSQSPLGRSLRARRPRRPRLPALPDDGRAALSSVGPAAAIAAR